MTVENEKDKQDLHSGKVFRPSVVVLACRATGHTVQISAFWLYRAVCEFKPVSIPYRNRILTAVFKTINSYGTEQKKFGNDMNIFTVSYFFPKGCHFCVYLQVFLQQLGLVMFHVYLQFTFWFKGAAQFWLQSRQFHVFPAEHENGSFGLCF